MSDLFVDEEIIEEDCEIAAAIENNLVLVEEKRSGLDARRRLEDLLEERRLREELEDYLD